jgi:hypothetical protein
MAKIWLLAANNQTINVHPSIIKMLLDYAQGKEDSSTLQTNVVVNNVFQMEQTGQFTKPEPKELSY